MGKSLKMMADSKDPIQSVQTFGRKKTTTAVAYCKRGKGLIRVNGKPLTEVEPKALQHKLTEPVQLLGQDRFADVDVRIRVKGGGRIAQVYAIKDTLVQYDRSLLVADPRRCEPKKFGGPGAR